MGIALAFLFILQIISFLVITLLYLKLSKFQSLEKKQQKLMLEMDRSAAAFLAEIKEENDRLIEQISRRPSAEMPQTEIPSRLEKAEPLQKNETAEQKARPLPVQVALRSYQKNTAAAKPQDEKPANDFQKAKALHEEGKTVEEIAKALGKGQTEIELLLKFG